MANEWRWTTLRPLINSKFDGRVVALWVVSILLYLITPLTFHLYLTLLVTLLEIYRLKTGTYSIGDAIKLFMQTRFSRVKHGKRRNVFNAFAVVMLGIMSTQSNDVMAGYTVIPPKEHKPPVSSFVPDGESIPNGQYWPKGDEFINNVNIKKGGGRDVELGKLLSFILPSNYKTTFVSVEIESMKVEWYSDNWTLDQILGNLAVRYGLMFEKMKGTANLRIDWYDEGRCLGADERNRVISTLCGTTQSYL